MGQATRASDHQRQITHSFASLFTVQSRTSQNRLVEYSLHLGEGQEAVKKITGNRHNFVIGATLWAYMIKGLPLNNVLIKCC